MTSRHPDTMTDTERCAEIAGILAVAYRRLCQVSSKKPAASPTEQAYVAVVAHPVDRR